MNSLLKYERNAFNAPADAARDAGLEDFRDQLSTADRQGRRRWLYPKRPSGRYYRRRTYLSWLLLSIMFTGPFVRIQGEPLLMLNIVDRRFSILGQIFWPQDTVIFAVAMLLIFTCIILFTAAFGRLWCGWACPQTLLMEMVFRKIEYWLEGDSLSQRSLATAPWTLNKTARKFLKHSLFFALSFLIGNTLLSYIIGIDQLRAIVTDDPRNHLTGLSFMFLFTAVFYLIFARFREQACTFICPYGRLQAVLIDDNTMTVAYDHRRGERRGRLIRRQKEERQTAGLGDCIDCRECVAVCPTGIDIRNGAQMECVNCTACVDACDAVMEKIRRPLGLIRHASLASIEEGEPFRFTPRMAGYSTVIAVLALILGVLVFNRPEVELALLRAPGSLYQLTPSGVQNLYTLKAVNKTGREIPIQLKLENDEGALRMMGIGQEELIVPPGGLAQTSILVEFEPDHLPGPSTGLQIAVYSDGKRLRTMDTVFIGPRQKPNSN